MNRLQTMPNTLFLTPLPLPLSRLRPISGYLVEMDLKQARLTAGVHVNAVYGLLILANIYRLN